MGIRINPNTWREPLRLIDSWLPSPSSKTVTVRGLPQLLQRFARAGWLGKRPASSGTTTPTACGSTHILVASPVCRVRVRHASVAGSHSDARLVISGKMADVCAELERLAALEQQGKTSLI